MFVRTQPTNAKWCEQQHKALKDIIPKLIQLLSRLDKLACEDPDAQDKDAVQGMADSCDKLENELVEIKGCCDRLLGKKRKMDSAGQQAAEKQ